MSISKSYENLKAIRFAGELLPNWAQLLDIAARLCPVPEEARHWFSRFTTGSGVDDARTVIDHCSLLREAIQAQRDSITAELRRIHDDIQPAQIFGAWIYALDTMIQAAKTNQTCSWIIEGSEDRTDDGSAGGEIGLRRV